MYENMKRKEHVTGFMGIRRKSGMNSNIPGVGRKICNVPVENFDSSLCVNIVKPWALGIEI